MKTFVQIGAGVGDKDPRTSFRDGFAELVKAQDQSTVGRIILVEPNPINHVKLMECWAGYSVQIYPIGVRSSSEPNDELTFYYCKEDGPYYQTFSMNKHHVLKHYPKGTIETAKIRTVTINEFLAVCCPGPIEMLALDVEGIDAEILLDIDWGKFDIRNVSFEHIHLDNKAQSVYNMLEGFGYVHKGRGLDPFGYDTLYSKETV